jgi:hypothetical protein
VNADPALLRKAAEIIRDGGLSKGLFRTDDGRHCAVGALMEAAHGEEVWKGGPNANDPVVTPAIQTLAEVVIPGGVGAVWLPIYNWNDDLHRTADQVVSAFEQAAQKAEATP